MYRVFTATETIATEETIHEAAHSAAIHELLTGEPCQIELTRPMFDGGAMIDGGARA